MKTVRLDVTEEQWARVKELAEDRGVSVSAILSEFVRCLAGDGFGSDERELASRWLSREAGNLYGWD